MQKSCRQCQSSFEVTADDLAFYDKVSPVFNGKKELIPPPTLCPDCRMQRRETWRNERTLYRRTCDLTGESIISMYATEKPFPVYKQQEWWSDRWDAATFGREVSFVVPFFDQFRDLLHAVPQMSLYNVLCEQNCEFVNIEYDDKNCYMCFAGGYCEDCQYGLVVIRGKDCIDCQKLNICELCYELTDGERCNRCFFSQHLENCSDCWLCFDLQGCTDCFGCAALRNKHYCFFNEQLTKEDYDARLRTINTGSCSTMEKMKDRFLSEVYLKVPHKFAHLIGSEDCSGDYIRHCSNCEHCFDTDESKDLKYVTLSEQLKDTRDCYVTGWPAELCYDSMSQCLNAYHNAFSNFCWNGSTDLYYCDHCFACQHCFGCVGLRHKKFCVLNKQYTKEEYEELVPKLIAFMRTPGEWGEFFPVVLSPFAYNESIAQDDFPLTKEEVRLRSWAWADRTDETPKVAKVISSSQLPDAIADIPDDILQWAMECEATKRLFKLTKQELAFYRSMKLPLPRLHPDERHRRRRLLRNSRKLWNRPCMKCGKEMETTYSPERPEIVYCEDCYLKEVY